MNGVSKRIWLLLYCEGGRWSAAEIRRTLELTGRTAGALAQTLDHMRTTGFLDAWDEPDHQLERRLRFGVTQRCKVPRGVNLEEMSCAVRVPELKAA